MIKTEGLSTKTFRFVLQKNKIITEQNRTEKNTDAHLMKNILN